MKKMTREQKKNIKKKFVADRNLGKLCRLLRMMGLDCVFARTSVPSELIEIAKEENRVILTRKKNITSLRYADFLIIQDEMPFNQAIEVVKAYDIDPLENAFTRCIECNVPLIGVKKEDVRGKVPSYIFKTRDEFFMCPSCGRIYWRGTHKDNMREILEEIKKGSQDP